GPVGWRARVVPRERELPLEIVTLIPPPMAAPWWWWTLLGPPILCHLPLPPIPSLPFQLLPTELLAHPGGRASPSPQSAQL
ncbi:hypothetical protein NDU88_006673, partial [Pleurodeles waltl]